MTEQEFQHGNRGMRGFLACLIIAVAVCVGLKTWSMGWFYITLGIGVIVRLAPLACMLDRLDASRAVEQAKEATRKA